MSNGIPSACALAGKRIAILGGTAGLGLSAAKAFIAAGARVVAVGLKSENVAAAQQELGEAAIVLQGDATQPDTAVAAVARAVSAWGGLDGLYHVAGGSGRRWGDGPLHELTDAGWDATLNLNLTSVFYSNRAAVRQFLAQGTGGSVLNLLCHPVLNHRAALTAGVEAEACAMLLVDFFKARRGAARAP